MCTGDKHLIKTNLRFISRTKNMKYLLSRDFLLRTMEGLQQQLCVLALALFFGLKGVSSASSEAGCLKTSGVKTCHSTDPNPYRFYGTKTAYHVVTQNETALEEDFGDCMPKVFYLFSRHATRYPDKKYIEEMIVQLPVLEAKILDAFANGRTNMCERDIDKLKNWNLTLKPEDDKKISESGKAEAEGLGRRLKARFPSLLDRGHSSAAEFAFEHTSRPRTQTTARAFFRGLFGRDDNFTGKTNDEVLQFHKDCDKFKEACNMKSPKIEELEKFGNSSFISHLISSVSKRVGFPVTFEDIEIMYRSCASAYALEQDDSWCSVFSSEDLKILEYEGDIDDYYKDAYGHKLNYEQACPVVKFLGELINSTMRNPNRHRNVFQFSHSGAAKKVFALFGLFRDKKPLMADNFCSLQDRKWKASRVDPFNTNMAFVLLQCGSEFEIATYHNERPITIHGCGSHVCPIEDFFAAYGEKGRNCDLKELCCSCC